jgi:signal transduction histidine kinase
MTMAERVDWLTCIALIVLLTSESLLASGMPNRAVTALFAVAFAAPVAVRRRWPAAAVLWSTAMCVLQDPFDGQLLNLPGSSAVIVLLLCSYGAGAWLAPRHSVVVLAVSTILLATDQVVEQHVTYVSGGGWSGLGILLLLFLAPAVFGWFVRQRIQRGRAFAALAAQTVVERNEQEREAVDRERLIIGRELQDVIAHSVSLMVVQTGGARRMLRDQPDRAREAILNVEQTGRDALAEMRRLLGLLRKDDDPRALSPQPGLDQLPDLAFVLEGAAGLRCELRTEGTAIELTPGINLVAFRVLESGLQLAASLGCQRVSATVQYQSRQLVLEVQGDRQLSHVSEAVQSVAERVELYGGNLEVLNQELTHFTIRCFLPLEGVVAA